MGNYVILKWGTLKAYHFEDNFIEKNKDIVEKFANIWDEIYSQCCTATGGSEYTQEHKDLKQRLVDVLRELWGLEITFENGWSDEIYRSFEEIEDYILNYGE